MSAAISTSKNIRQKKVRLSKSMLKINNEDLEILYMLEKIKDDLDNLHNSFDQVTEPVLIDSCIFEIQSLHMKYKYYLQKCKERGLVAHGSSNSF